MRIISWQVLGSKKQLIENRETLEMELKFPVYDCSVYVLDEKKLIFKIDCMCPNFKGMRIGKDKFMGSKRIKTFGQFQDAKYYAEPCKHLKPVVDALIKLGYELKKPKQMEGSDKLSAALRRTLLERADNRCEGLIMGERCNSTSGLQVHRKVRGSAGGKYNEENCVVLCWNCHMGPNGVHGNEFRGCQGK